MRFFRIDYALGQHVGVQFDLVPEESPEWHKNDLSATWLWRAEAEGDAWAVYYR